MGTRISTEPDIEEGEHARSKFAPRPVSPGALLFFLNKQKKLYNYTSSYTNLKKKHRGTD